MFPDNISGTIARTDTCIYYLQAEEGIFLIPPELPCGAKQLHLQAIAKVQSTSVKGWTGEVVELQITYID